MLMRRNRTFEKSILAGVLISFAMYTSLIAQMEFGKLIGALVFPIGFAAIVCLEAKLFTGALYDLSEIKPKELFSILLWNSIACITMGIIMRLSSTEALKELAAEVMRSKIDENLILVLIQGFLCESCILMAVNLSRKGRSTGEKFFLSMPMIFFFVICGFEHFVANTFLYSFVIGGKDSFLYFLRALLNLFIILIGHLLAAFFFKIMKENEEE